MSEKAAYYYGMTYYETAPGPELDQNDTEQAVLAAFPEPGIDLGYVARALIFAPAVCNLPLKQHAALVSLVRLGRLGICVGNRDGQTVEILARLN